MADPDKAAVRTDLPVPDANPGSKEPNAGLANPTPVGPAAGENPGKPADPIKEGSPESPR
jgi:hypothetical protein